MPASSVDAGHDLVEVFKVSLKKQRRGYSFRSWLVRLVCSLVTRRVGTWLRCQVVSAMISAVSMLKGSYIF